MPLRVMTWNVSYCRSSSRIDDVAAFIRQNTPDIVLLQEIAISGSLAGGMDQPAELAARTGLRYQTFGMDGNDGEVGNAVLSRFPLEGTERILFAGNEFSSILKTRAVINGVVHHIYTTHPRPPNLDLCVDALVRHVLALDPMHAVIVGGDFNAPVDRLANDGRLTDIPASLDDRPELPPGYDVDGFMDHLLFRGAYAPMSLEVRHPFGQDLTDHAWHVVTLYESTIPALVSRIIDVPESSTEVDTGIGIGPDECFELRAGGQIWAGVWFTNLNGPTGWNAVDHDPKFPLHTGPNAFPYSLIGRFGPAGEYFYVGRGLPRAPFMGQATRRLLLRINDDSPSNGTGAFTCRVLVSVDPPRPVLPNDAECVGQRVPIVMEAGQSYPVSVTMKNTGTNTWRHRNRNPHRLGSQNSSVWGPTRIELPDAVAPNEEVAFDFSVRAPWRPAVYTFQWRMVQGGVEWFGNSTPVRRIRVQAPE